MTSTAALGSLYGTLRSENLAVTYLFKNQFEETGQVSAENEIWSGVIKSTYQIINPALQRRI